MNHKNENISKIIDLFRFHAMDDRGLLSCLRPYIGLDFDALIKLKEGLNILVGEAASGQEINMEMISLIYTVIWTVRVWSLPENSILRQSKLIDEKTLSKLSEWVPQMERTFLKLLGTLEDRWQLP